MAASSGPDGVRANAMIEACSLPQLTLASACRLA
jgi:hypothetical protein